MNFTIYNKILTGIQSDYKALEYIDCLSNIPFLNYIFHEIIMSSILYSANYYSMDLSKLSNVSINLTAEQIESYVLDFYKSIDSRLQKKALEYITNQNGSKLIFSEDIKDSYVHRHSYNIQLKNSKVKKIYKNNSDIFVNKTHNSIQDIYTLAHEIAHTFSSNKNTKSPNNLFVSEIVPFFTEILLDEYLKDSDLITSHFICIRELDRLDSSILSIYVKMARLSLVEKFINNKKLALTEEQVNKTLTNYHISNSSLLISYKSSITHFIPYVFAYLFSYPNFKDFYNYDKSGALDSYLQVCIDLKNNKDFYTVFSNLGVSDISDFNDLIKDNAIYSRFIIDEYRYFIPQNNNSSFER